MIAQIPVVPDPPTARDCLRQVLAGSEYQRAKPTLLDYLLEWLRQQWVNLQAPAAPDGPPLVVVVIPLVLVGIGLLAGLLVYGVPRLRHRRGSGDLFGEDDDRDADALRRAATVAASDGDWATAIVEQFRAISRALADRTVVSISPGTTAHGVARNAGPVFPESAASLESGADAFDLVRYLGGAGTRGDWDRLVALDRELAASDPVLENVPLVGTSRPGAPILRPPR